MTRRRVVVTGLGATTPLGGDVATTWAGLLAGKSGVRSLTEDWAQTIPVTFAARVAVEPSEQMERVEIRRLDRSEQFGLIASREAWKDAGSPEVDKERLGVVVASGIGGVTTLLDQYDILNTKGSRLVSPHTVPMLMPNGPAANIGLELQAQAGVHTPVSACASGAEAIGYAFDMIRNNRADIVVSGGVEAACHALPMAAFAAMKALSTRNDDPARPGGDAHCSPGHGGHRHAFRLLRGQQGRGLRQRRADHEGNRRPGGQGRERPDGARHHRLHGQARHSGHGPCRSATPGGAGRRTGRSR